MARQWRRTRQSRGLPPGQAPCRAARPAAAPRPPPRTSERTRRAKLPPPPKRAWPRLSRNWRMPGGGRAIGECQAAVAQSLPQCDRQDRLQERGILIPVDERPQHIIRIAARKEPEDLTARSEHLNRGKIF